MSQSVVEGSGPECDFTWESLIPQAKSVALAQCEMCSLEWNQEDKIKDEVIRVSALHQDSTSANGWLQSGTGYFDPLGYMAKYSSTSVDGLLSYWIWILVMQAPSVTITEY